MIDLSPMQRRNVLLFTHYQEKLRHSVYSHIIAFKKYSSHNIIEINTAFSVDWQSLKALDPDAIILHSRFLSLRWAEKWPVQFEQICLAFAESSALKIATPQDEFLNSSILERLFLDIGVTKVFTCASLADLPKIYPKTSAGKIEFIETLTGYVSDDIAQTEALPLTARKFFVTYRAWSPQAWLGQRASLKAKIGIEAVKICKKLNLAHDISIDEKHTITGYDWIKHLMESRCVIGMEGGAAIADNDGMVKALVESGQNVPKGRDGEISLFCISPRHFEAAGLRVLQILVEGNYNGIFVPNVHYIPVKADLSDLEEAILKANNDEIATKIINRAHQDLVASGKYGYRNFIEVVDDVLRINSISKPNNWSNSISYMRLKMRAKTMRFFARFYDKIALIVKFKNKIINS